MWSLYYYSRRDPIFVIFIVFLIKFLRFSFYDFLSLLSHWYVFYMYKIPIKITIIFFTVTVNCIFYCQNIYLFYRYLLFSLVKRIISLPCYHWKMKLIIITTIYFPNLFIYIIYFHIDPFCSNSNLMEWKLFVFAKIIKYPWIWKTDESRKWLRKTMKWLRKTMKLSLSQDQPNYHWGKICGLTYNC